MKKHLSRLASIVMLMLFFAATALLAQENMKPSKALEMAGKLYREKIAQFRDAQKTNPDLAFDNKKAIADINEELLKNVQKEGLDPQEQISLARIYENVGENEKALDLYGKVSAGSGEAAEKASGWRLMLLFKIKRYEDVGKAITAHQQRFDYAADEDAGIFMRVLGAYVARLAGMGEHKAAVDLLLAEINRLPDPPQFPYSAPDLIGRNMKSFMELGRKDEAVKLIEHYLAAYKALRAKKPAEGKNRAKAHSTPVERIIRKLETTLIKFALVGEKAPAIQFSRVFNAADVFNFADLKGKVVLLDFWANWCGPCKRAFPSLRKIYAEFRNKDFVIIGVTGLQGRFADGDVNLKKVGPEQEFTLTEELIKRHEMTWPIVFSDRGPFDPEYGVSGIPTMVILDKNGTVREIKSGFNPDEVEALRKIIQDLLTE